MAVPLQCALQAASGAASARRGRSHGGLTPRRSPEFRRNFAGAVGLNPYGARRTPRRMPYQSDGRRKHEPPKHCTPRDLPGRVRRPGRVRPPPGGRKERRRQTQIRLGQREDGQVAPQALADRQTRRGRPVAVHRPGHRPATRRREGQAVAASRRRGVPAPRLSRPGRAHPPRRQGRRLPRQQRPEQTRPAHRRVAGQRRLRQAHGRRLG